MKEWFFNVDEFLEHRVEVSALCAGKGTGDILPDAESGPNSDTCPSTTLLCISHLLYDPHLFHKQTASCSFLIAFVRMLQAFAETRHG